MLAMNKEFWAVTGAAGFIGSVLMAHLNEQGMARLVAVDRLDSSEKWKNLRGRRFEDYIDADDFIERLGAGQFDTLKGILHLGACSSTTETDARFLMKNNYEYTKTLALWALKKRKRLIYASSAATYGDGLLGYKTDDATTERLKPLNPYGYSKQLFDLWALRQGVLKKFVGIKFFNVFGPNEYHKGDMRSVVAKAFEQIRADGRVRLFKSYRRDYADGEQQRDFLYVKDAVRVLGELMQRPELGGLFNLGAGQARTWNDLVRAVFAAMGKPPKIVYIDMPDILKAKYQYHTEADMRWRAALKGVKPLGALEEGVRDYVQNYLMKDDPYL